MGKGFFNILFIKTVIKDLFNYNKIFPFLMFWGFTQQAGQHTHGKKEELFV